ncbi:MAG: hypothetical protein WD272_04400 [Balneolales bacterium]
MAQDRIEPDLAEMEQPLTHYDFNMRNGMSFRFQMNNFGFAVGGEYRRVLSRYTQGMIEFQVTNIRDEGEQSFQNFWGFTVIPNKYNRILSVPVMLGINHRIFANQLSDDFRFQFQISGGPSPSLVYPYFNDRQGYGFRRQGFRAYEDQPHYDPFQGWGDGELVLGGAGQLSLGADMGGDFAKIQSIFIGYYFHYFPDGIQVMEPNRPGHGFNPDPSLTIDDQPAGAIVPATGKQYFFGSPHITFIFGSMW